MEFPVYFNIIMQMQYLPVHDFLFIAAVEPFGIVLKEAPALGINRVTHCPSLLCSWKDMNVEHVSTVNDSQDLSHCLK